RRAGLRSGGAQAGQPRPGHGPTANGGSMSKDFVTTLRLQLREAAEREARRGPVRRALPDLRLRPLAVAAALALVLAAIVFAGIRITDHREVPTTVAPTIVARVALVD